MSDPVLVRNAKRVLPAPAKSAVGAALRGALMATSPLRGLPDFLLAGAKRCGSTSLYRYLLAHPDVAPLLPEATHKKGTHYFDRHPTQSQAWYRSHFPLRLGRGRVTGEASTYYFAHPYAAQRAAEVIPDAKVVVLLRDPVERAFSHYRDEVKMGNEALPFADALEAEESRLAPELARMAADPSYYSFAHEHFSYASWGLYAQHLQRWLDVYPAEQLLVLQSEDLFTRPEHVYRQVTDFLGLRPFAPHFERHNAAPVASRDDAALRWLRDFYAGPNEELRRLLPTAPAW